MSDLQRRIGVPGAIAIGLGSMIGAGLFFVWAPASALAGQWLPASLGLAAIVAVLNALSTAQLAMEHPVSGGAYAYGRAEVGERVGFVAGWLFLSGKTASAGAIALIAGAHLWPGMEVPVAIAAIVVLATVNMLGVRLTSWTSAGIVAVVLVAVAAALVWAAAGGTPHGVSFGWVAYAPLSDATLSSSGGPAFSVDDDGSLSFLPAAPSPLDVLQASGLLFFAFAGYARMATLGEEVRDPRRTLPRAIVAGLAIVLALYGLVAWATTARLGDGLPVHETPLADLVGLPVLHVILLVAGGLACLGSLVGVLAGLSRTSLAMARGRDLPGVLAHVSTRTKAPVVAESAVAILAIVAVLVVPAGSLVAFSSTCVLGYYAVAHLAAGARIRSGAAAWLPAWIPIVGGLLCALLVVTLPWAGVLGALVWTLVGLALRALARRRP